MACTDVNIMLHNDENHIQMLLSVFIFSICNVLMGD